MSNLLTTEEAAAVLRAAPVTVKRWALEGRLPDVRIGKLRRFSADTIERVAREGLPARREA